jgi:hypothetical protein
MCVCVCPERKLCFIELGVIFSVIIQLKCKSNMNDKKKFIYMDSIFIFSLKNTIIIVSEQPEKWKFDKFTGVCLLFDRTKSLIDSWGNVQVIGTNIYSKKNINKSLCTRKNKDGSFQNIA